MKYTQFYRTFMTVFLKVSFIPMNCSLMFQQSDLQSNLFSVTELDVAKQSVEHTENKLKAFERRIEQLSRLLRESRNREKSADKGKINMG